MKYRKKPVVIDAIVWTGENFDEFKEFTGRHAMWHEPSKTVLIETLEGDMWANKGDHIIKGVKGEFYPCKPDIFKMTYEVVE